MASIKFATFTPIFNHMFFGAMQVLGKVFAQFAIISSCTKMSILVPTIGTLLSMFIVASKITKVVKSM